MKTSFWWAIFHPRMSIARYEEVLTIMGEQAQEVIALQDEVAKLKKAQKEVYCIDGAGFVADPSVMASMMRNMPYRPPSPFESLMWARDEKLEDK